MTDRHLDPDTLQAIERRATQIWLRRRLTAIGAGLTALLFVAVPVAALNGGGDDRHTIEAADGGETAEPDPAPSSPPETVTTVALDPPPTTSSTTGPPDTTPTTSCGQTDDAVVHQGDDGGLHVELVASGTRSTVGCVSSIDITGTADPAEVVVVNVEWGDGNGEGDPQPSMICESPSREAVAINRTFDHSYAEGGEYTVTVQVMSYICGDDEVTSDRVTLETVFTVLAT